MLPNFLVIGAEKAATTWLYIQLKKHPQIFLPETKEIRFFEEYDSIGRLSNRYERFGLPWYERFFRQWEGEPVVGEVNPMYLCDGKAPYRIQKILPDVKLIASLRNPVDRAYSHYWMEVWKGRVKRSFEEIVAARDPQFIQRGLYYQQLKIYFDLFPREQLFVLLMEEAFSDRRRALNEVFDFLKVDPAAFDEAGLAERVNEATTYKSVAFYQFMNTWVRRLREHRLLSRTVDVAKQIGIARLIKEGNKKKATYPPMDPKQREELLHYYESDIEALEDLLDLDLSLWKGRERAGYGKAR